jgi:hypothetical protein
MAAFPQVGLCKSDALLGTLLVSYSPLPPMYFWEGEGAGWGLERYTGGTGKPGWGIGELKPPHLRGSWTISTMAGFYYIQCVINSQRVASPPCRVLTG